MNKVFLLIFSLFLVCCTTIVTAADVSALYSKKWLLTQLQQIVIEKLNYPNEAPNIVFDAAGRYSAYAGCNRIGGSFTVADNGELKFDPNAIMTKMACMDPNNIEDQFVAMLSEVSFWLIENNSLTLQNNQRVNLATFINTQ